MNPEVIAMSSQPHAPQTPESDDPVERIVHSVPVVLPVVGGLLMFLLAFIAIAMA
jgi:hypothetical protein